MLWHTEHRHHVLQIPKEALGADEEVDGETSQSQSQSREKLRSIGINFSKLKKDERQVCIRWHLSAALST